MRARRVAAAVASMAIAATGAGVAMVGSVSTSSAQPVIPDENSWDHVCQWGIGSSDGGYVSGLVHHLGEPAGLVTHEQNCQFWRTVDLLGLGL